MKELIRLINILKEFSKQVFADFDHGTVLVFLPKKFYQDLLVAIEKANIDVIYRCDFSKKDYLIVLSPMCVDDTTVKHGALSADDN